MQNIDHIPLLLMTFLPALTAFVIMLAPCNDQNKLARVIALGGSVLTLLVGGIFVHSIFNDPAHYFASVDAFWIRAFNIKLLMGMDGLSGMLVLLTNILQILAIAASWTAIGKRTKEFYFFLMLLQTGILGTFLALDMILFYCFWELMLIPLYFLIGIFGSGNRIYATTKFFLFTMTGSLLMLIGMLALYFKYQAAHAGVGTFSLYELVPFASQLPPDEQLPLFLAFFIAFAIKAPLFPLHTWLPDAHTKAPTAGSIILAGVLLKTGVYGMLRFCIPMFPAASIEMAPTICLLSVVAIVYGALTAFRQTDMKRLVAYSSVSHMGFIVLGIFALQSTAITGASFQMLCHGVSTGGLFLAVGCIYERRHTREMSEFGGLARNMKIYTVLTIIMVLSSVGLPGLNGFVGEFLILMGSFQTQPWLAAVAGTGVILAACYLLRMTQLTFFGDLSNDENKGLSDLNARESFSLIVLCALSLWMGMFSPQFTHSLEPASADVMQSVAQARRQWGYVAPPSFSMTAGAQAAETQGHAETHGHAEAGEHPAH